MLRKREKEGAVLLSLARALVQGSNVLGKGQLPHTVSVSTCTLWLLDKEARWKGGKTLINTWRAVRGV